MSSIWAQLEPPKDTGMDKARTVDAKLQEIQAALKYAMAEEEQAQGMSAYMKEAAQKRTAQLRGETFSWLRDRCSPFVQVHPLVSNLSLFFEWSAS